MHFGFTSPPVKMNAELLAAARDGTAAQLEALLREGADVFYTDANGDTALTAALQRSMPRSTVVAVLLAHSADVNHANATRETPLTLALRHEHADVAHKLLAAGADVNHTTKENETPLTIAIQAEMRSLARKLVEAGANVEHVVAKNETPIMVAARLGFAGLVEVLVAGGANVNHVNQDGDTPLTLAVKRARAEIVDKLISAGADVNYVNPRQGDSVLMEAAQSFMVSKELVLRLIEAGADVRHANQASETALTLAAEVANVGVVRALIRAGGDVNYTTSNGDTPLLLATLRGSVDVVKELATAGANVDSTDNQGLTPLSHAIALGNMRMVDQLLAAKADSNRATVHGIPAMAYAVQQGMEELVDKFLASGWKSNNVADRKEFPLSLAIRNGHEGIARKLISAGVDTNWINHSGWTTLLEASSLGCTAIAEKLVEAGSNINHASVDGDTALHLAALNGHDATVQLLLRLGADPSLQNANGKIPFQVAIDSGHAAVAQHLGECNRRIAFRAVQDCRIDLIRALNSLDFVSTRDDQGCTLLHVSARIGDVEICKLLVERGVDISCCDQAGWTALDYAWANKNTKCVAWLMENGADLEILQDQTQLKNKAGALSDSIDAARLIDCALCASTLQNSDIENQQSTFMELFPYNRECEDAIGTASARMSRIVGRFRGLTQPLRGRELSRVVPTPSEVAAQGENAVEAYMSDLSLTSTDEQITRYYKICVLGSSARTRAAFVSSLTHQDPEFVNASLESARVSKWTFSNFDPESNESQPHVVSVWDLPEKKEFEAANSLFFSECTTYIVCVDLSQLTSNSASQELVDESYRWFRFVHTCHASATVVFVDTSSGLSDEERDEALQAFNSGLKQIQVRFLRVIRRQTMLAEAALQSDLPHSLRLALNLYVSRLEEMKRGQDLWTWFHGSPESVQHKLQARLVNSQTGFALCSLQREIIDTVEKCNAMSAGTDGGTRMKLTFLRRDKLFHLLRESLPHLDSTTFDGSVQILHRLGVVYHFEDSVEDIVCTDARLWAQAVYSAVDAAGSGASLLHKNLQFLELWGEIKSADSMLLLKTCLLSSQIVTPMAYPLVWDSNTALPSLRILPHKVTLPHLVLGSQDSETQYWKRAFNFMQEPEISILSKIATASHVPSLHLVEEDGILNLSSDSFVARLFAQQVDDRLGWTLTLEALGFHTWHKSNRLKFRDLSNAIESVLEKYPGIWVTRQDGTWMPSEWAYEDIISHRSQQCRPRDAVVVDEIVQVDNICVVGPSHWGKTTLAKSLTMNAVCLEHSDSRTVGVNVFDGSFIETDPLRAFGRRHAVTFCDFAGEAKYQSVQGIFFPQSTLFLICVDLRAYAVALEQARFMAEDDATECRMMKRFVRRKILSWVDKVVLRKSDADYAFVATKADLLKGDKNRLDKITSHFVDILTDHCNRYPEEIQKVVAAEDPKWITVSCKSLRSVFQAQRGIEDLIISSKRSKVLPKSYARTLMAVRTRRENLQSVDFDDHLRVSSAIVSAEVLGLQLQKVVPSVAEPLQRHILAFLHDLGEILCYDRFDGVEFKSNDVILDPRLVVDLARVIFEHECPSEQLAHVRLRTLPLWQHLSPTTTMLDMKRILCALRVVYPVKKTMKAESDLLVPAYWTHVHCNLNIHVAPLFMKYTRAAMSTHRYHVLWKYYLDKVLDESFFERLAVASYSSVYNRRVYNGLIKYSTNVTQFGSDVLVPMDQPFCQVWIDQDQNDDGHYVVCVEAVAGSEADESIWIPFGLVCAAIRSSHDGETPLAYAVDGLSERKVEDVIDDLRQRPGMNKSLSHQLSWMPPRLEIVESVGVADAA